MRTFYVVLCGLTVVAAASRVAAVTGETEQASTPNVFAQALVLGQEVRSQTEMLEHALFKKTITSPAIEVARKKVSALTLRWSGNVSEEDKADILKELADARKTLRDLVFAHPKVKRAFSVLEADKAKLLELNQRILTIRAQQKQRQAQAVTPAPGDAAKE